MNYEKVSWGEPQNFKDLKKNISVCPLAHELGLYHQTKKLFLPWVIIHSSFSCKIDANIPDSPMKMLVFYYKPLKTHSVKPRLNSHNLNLPLNIPLPILTSPLHSSPSFTVHNFPSFLSRFIMPSSIRPTHPIATIKIQNMRCLVLTSKSWLILYRYHVAHWSA